MRNPFAITEDPKNPVPKEAFGWRVYYMAISACWATAMFGYDSAFIGGTLSLPSFQHALGLDAATTTALSSNIVSTFQGGAFFGVILGTIFSERFGRKWVIFGSGCLFMIGAGIQLIGQLGPFYAGRVLTGLGVGASSVLVPLYISECSPAPIRGRLVGMFDVTLQFFIVFGFWINYGVNQNIPATENRQWMIPVAMQFVPAAFLLISMLWNIESPRWLIAHNKHEQAHKVLSWVRNLPMDHEYLTNELSEMTAAVEHEKQFNAIKELKSSSIRNRILLLLCLLLLQNLTGINAINYYSPTLFKSIGYTGTSTGLFATGVYGLLKMISTVFFLLFVIDKAGRRVPLLIGAVGACFCMFYLGIYSKATNSFNQLPPADAGAQAAVAMIYLWAIFYGFSWNGIPWIYAAEILPTRVRGFGMMCAICMQWLSQFMVVYSLPYMVRSIQYGIFFFFAAGIVVAFFFVWFFVPETKGVTLEDMELLFGPQSPTLARAKRRAYNDAHSTGLTGNKMFVLNRREKGEMTAEEIEQVV